MAGIGSNPTLDAELNRLLLDLRTSAKLILQENFIGIYLTGSLAVGDFDDDSDVDFIVMIHHKVTDEQLLALQAMHVRLHHAKTKWATCLEGYYIVQSELHHYDAARAWHLYLDNGSEDLEVVTDHHKNWIFERFVLQEYAVTLEGPEPRSLFETIPVKALQDTVFTEMRRWSSEIVANPEPLNNRWRQSFMVLSLCRMMYTFEFGAIVSKAVAVQWAKKTLEPQWTALIERAWAEREDPPRKARMQTELTDVEATPGFIRYALEFSQRYFE